MNMKKPLPHRVTVFRCELCNIDIPAHRFMSSFVTMNTLSISLSGSAPNVALRLMKSKLMKGICHD